jgi:hypothetical protein
MAVDVWANGRMRSCWMFRSSLCLLIIVVVAIGRAIAGGMPTATAPAVEPRPLVLLVGGIAVDFKDRTSIWGRHKVVKGQTVWDGMIGGLVDRGYRFGGFIRPRGPRIQLPETLDTRGVSTPAVSADLFVLEYSATAQVDGLLAKTLELVQCIKELKRTTGRTKVALVAHSAGGIVARTYLQEALPGIPYEGDVSLLVTIGTPHLGAALATHLGDYLGTRATSLKPDAPLLDELNNRLDLPSDVRFASLVVKGLGADIEGDGKTYDKQLDRKMLRRLPIDYRRGGDQVVHAKSQNLALTRSAGRYEAKTGKPIQFAAVRVADPSPGDWCYRDETVHVAAPRSPQLAAVVALLLKSDSIFEAGSAPADGDESLTCESLRKFHADFCALTLVEDAALEKHWLTEVVDLRIDPDRSLLTEDTTAAGTYGFEGSALSRGSLFGCREYTTRVTGRLTLKFDRFGRPSEPSHKINSVAEIDD